jgi:hypothetical protein
LLDGLLDGVLGGAGMMTSLVMKWIIPDNSLRLAPVRISREKHVFFPHDMLVLWGFAL